MKPARTNPREADLSAPVPGLLGGLRHAWVAFWFAPAAPTGLHVVRVLGGLVLLGWLMSAIGQVGDLYGLQGWFDRQAYVESARLPGGPPKPISWSLLYAAGTNPQVLLGLYATSLAVLALFTLGVGTRVTGPLTWLIVASFTANPAVDTEADALLLLLGFYLMLGYLTLDLGGPGSLLARLGGRGLVWPADRVWAWLRGRLAPQESPGSSATFALRLLQVHLAIVITVSGLHKLQFGDWWSGLALWYLLHPPGQTSLAQAQAHAVHANFYLALLSACAYAALSWQISFPLFAWRQRGRLLLLGGAGIGCLGTIYLYREPFFGPALLAGCLSYISGAEWNRLGAWLLRVWQAGQTGPAAAEEPLPNRGKERDVALVTSERR